MPGLGFATGVARCHRLTQPLRVNDVTIMSPSGIITITDTNLYNLKRCGKHDPKDTPSHCTKCPSLSPEMTSLFRFSPFQLRHVYCRTRSSSNFSKEERFVNTLRDETKKRLRMLSHSCECYIKIEFITNSFNLKYKRTKRSSWFVRNNSKDPKFRDLFPCEPTINLSPRFRWRHHQRDP